MKPLLKVIFLGLFTAGCLHRPLGMDAGMEEKYCKDDWQVLEDFKKEADADDLQQSINFLNSHKEDLAKLFEWNDDTYGFLHYAAAIGKLELVKELIARDIPVDIRTGERGITPLLIAAREGHLAVLRELVKLRANVYAQDGGNAGALHYAAMSGNLDVFKEVAKVVGEKYTPGKDKNGFNVLHLAVLSNSVELAEYIINQYGNSTIGEQTNQGVTPLHFAANKGSQSMVKLFMQTSTCIEDNHKFSAARIARSKGFYTIEKLILPVG